MAVGTVRVLLIKPSHDAEGDVVQWVRSTLPSNSLGSVYGLVGAALPPSGIAAARDR
jgi:hypothetical protein